MLFLMDFDHRVIARNLLVLTVNCSFGISVLSPTVYHGIMIPKAVDRINQKLPKVSSPLSGHFENSWRQFYFSLLQLIIRPPGAPECSISIIVDSPTVHNLHAGEKTV